MVNIIFIDKINCFTLYAYISVTYIYHLKIHVNLAVNDAASTGTKTTGIMAIPPHGTESIVTAAEEPKISKISVNWHAGVDLVR